MRLAIRLVEISCPPDTLYNTNANKISTYRLHRYPLNLSDLVIKEDHEDGTFVARINFEVSGGRLGFPVLKLFLLSA
jgi:hypothetical protein